MTNIIAAKQQLHEVTAKYSAKLHDGKNLSVGELTELVQAQNAVLLALTEQT